MSQAEDANGKVIKAGVGYTVANYLIKGLAFITIPLFARLLSAADYGDFNIYLAYESVLTSVVGMALHMSLKNAKYKYDKQFHDYISSIILLNIVTLLAWEFTAALFGQVLTNALGMNRLTIIILIIHCCCSSLLATYNMYLSLAYSYKRYVLIAAINAILNIVLSVLLILTVFSDDRAFGRIIGTSTPLVLLSIFIIYSFWRKAAPKVNKGYWKFGLKYSLPLIPHAVSQVVLNQFDRIMIKSMISASSAGIYSFAYNVYMILEVTKASLDTVWGTWFYEQYYQGHYIEIKKRSKTYIYVFFLFTMIIMLLSPELIYVIGTPEYYDSKFITIPICAAGFYSFLYTLPAQVEYYHEKTNYIAIGTFIAAVVNIVLNYIFIKKFGYIAAAYTTEFTYFLYFGIHLFIAKKIALSEVLDIKTFVIAGAGCFIFSILGVILINYILVRVFFVIIIAGIGVVFSVKTGIAQYLLNKVMGSKR